VRIHHLNCASLCPPFAALTTGEGGLFSRGHMVCHCLLVESRAGLLLVDTGLGTEDVREPERRLGKQFLTMTAPVCDLAETALHQVEALGFSRADLRHILPTHLDLDHAGGLSDFPGATVHILGNEHRAAMAPRTLPERLRYRSAQWAHKPHFNVLEPTEGERWFGFEGVRPLAGTEDEVLIIPLYGHTRGHAGIAVRGEDGWVLHAGDAYFNHNAVHPTGKRQPAGAAVFESMVETVHALRVYNQERLRSLLQSHGGEVRVLCAHDPAELADCPGIRA
jgi:glyoxylase-like metal-dependent hydrolase (beta-lactamase superfamily II)